MRQRLDNHPETIIRHPLDTLTNRVVLKRHHWLIQSSEVQLQATGDGMAVERAFYAFEDAERIRAIL